MNPDRRNFIRALAASIPGLIGGCARSPDVLTGSYDGKVLVIGAGAAGMSAAHTLIEAGVDVSVLEAAPSYGGRIKTARDFVDFPIPLGGEWLHTAAEEVKRVAGVANHGIEMAAYGETETYGYWEEGEYSETEVEDTADLKFVGRTWLDVFEEFVLPSIIGNIQYNVVVTHVDYSGDRVAITTEFGNEIVADKVIVTAPLVQLRDNIGFTPPLPEVMQSALNDADVWGGFKAFIEFSDRFYPNFLEIAGRSGENGEHLYYNASYGQSSSAHVLGLFSVGTGAEYYQVAHARGELIDAVLAELDQIFDGKASATYMQHIAQDWSAEPHIGMAYLASTADWRIPRRFADPVDDRLYFAGDAYIADGEGWSMVHLAARSGRRAAGSILA